MGSFEYCAQILRNYNRSRWLSCLFAPHDDRPALFSLYAFDCEIARIRDLVSSPLPGEVRLQWWRDVLSGHARGHIEAHPVAVALLESIKRYNLPVSAFLALLDARAHDLYDDLFPEINDLEGYLGETASTLLRLASLILADGTEPDSAGSAGHGGVALGIADIFMNFGRYASQGRILLPKQILDQHGSARDDMLKGQSSIESRAAFGALAALADQHLTQALAGLSQTPPSIRVAFMPLALVKPVLRHVRTASYNPYQNKPLLAQWRIQWHLWRFSKHML